MSYYYRGARARVSSPRGRGRGYGSSMGRGRAMGRHFPNDQGVRDGVDPRNVFVMQYPDKYAGGSEILTKPKVVGSYSIDRERDFGHDQSMLHFLAPEYLPENKRMIVDLDLTVGWDKFNRYSGNTEESFQNFLRWIINNQDRVAAESSQRLNADFISVRGNFTKIMRTPYNYIEPWTMYAVEFKGSVYIINWKRQEECTSREDPLMDSITRWGHAFECYMTGGNPEDGIEANEEYRCVLKTAIGETSILYAPEVDCVDPEQFDEDFEDLDAFVLVKCCKEVIDEKKKRNHKRFKLNQWWVENQLSGIPRILVGYRNEDGKVHTLELIHTEDIPEMAQEYWEPSVCFNFLSTFLKFVKDRVHSEPGTTFIFDRESKGHIYCTKLSGDDHINLLPSWYTNGLFADDESD